MVHNQVDDDPDAAAVGRLQELCEVTQRAQPGMHVVIVADFVAAVPTRGGMDGIQPKAVDAEPGQVVKSASKPGEITDTVAVGVLEGLDVQAVDDCLLVPALGHVSSHSPSQM